MSITHDNHMKIITLGYTGVGKSYYLGSLHELSNVFCPNGTNLKDKNFLEKGIIRDYKDRMVEEDSPLISTPRAREHYLVLKRGSKTVAEIAVIDMVGQGVHPGSKEIGQETLDKISDCNGLIMMVKAPENAKEAKREIDHFHQLLNFADAVIRKEKRIVVSLVLTQIDLLPAVQGFQQKIDEWEADLTEELESEGKSHGEIEEAINAQRGTIMSALTKRALSTKPIYQVIKEFKQWILSSDYLFPNRIFPVTSIGFGNAKSSDEVEEIHVAKAGELFPYGSTTSFLWLIYAGLRLADEVDETLGIPSRKSKLLLEDLKYLQRSGKGYFDNEDELWSIENIGDLYQISK